MPPFGLVRKRLETSHIPEYDPGCGLVVEILSMDGATTGFNRGGEGARSPAHELSGAPSGWQR